MRVQVLLKTPLFRGRYGAQRSVELRSTVVEVIGEAAVRDGGLDVTVQSLFDDRGQPVAADIPRIFLPLGKIDCYVVLDG